MKILLTTALLSIFLFFNFRKATLQSDELTVDSLIIKELFKDSICEYKILRNKIHHFDNLPFQSTLKRCKLTYAPGSSVWSDCGVKINRNMPDFDTTGALYKLAFKSADDAHQYFDLLLADFKKIQTNHSLAENYFSFKSGFIVILNKNEVYFLHLLDCGMHPLFTRVANYLSANKQIYERMVLIRCGINLDNDTL